MSTPMSPSTKLDKDEHGKKVDEKTYRGMIGSLLYLTASRPDIMFSVCLYARFQSDPRKSHLKAVKRIIRYLKDIINLGLWYAKGTIFDLCGYSDVDFAIRRALVALANSLDTHLYHGLVGNKIVLLFPQPRPNISPPVLVLHKFYG